MLKKIFKIFSWIFLGFVLLIGAVAVLNWKTDLIERGIEDFINNELKEAGEIHYASLKGSLLNHVIIRDLEVTLPGQADVRAGLVELRYSLLPLLSGRMRISEILINKIEIALLSDSLQTPPASKTPAEPIHIDSLLAEIQKMQPTAALLDLLPAMQISDVKLFAGQIHSANPEISFKEVELQIKRINVGANSFNIEIHKVAGVWPKRNFHLRSLSLQLKGDREHLAINRFNLRTDSSRLSLSAFYRTQSSADININLYEFNLNFSDLYKLTLNKKYRDGFLSGTFTLSGMPRRFDAQARLKGRWQTHLLDSLEWDLGYSAGRFMLRKLDAYSGAAFLSLSGSGYQFSGGRGALAFSHINFNALDTALVKTDLNGRLRFDVQNLNLLRAQGSGSLEMKGSQIDVVPIDSLRFALQAERGNFKIKEPSFVQFADSSRFNLEGSVSRKLKTDLILSAFDNQLGQLVSFFGVDSLQAPFDGQIRLSGRLKDPAVSASLWIPALRWRDASFDSVSMNLYTEKLFSKRSGQAQFEIDKGEINGVPLRDINVRANIEGSRITVPKVTISSGKNYFNAALQFQYDSLESVLEISRAEMLYDGYRLQNNGMLRFTIGDVDITVDRFFLNGPAGSSLELGGFWDFRESDLQAYLTLHKIKLKPFEQFWQKKFNLSGVVAGFVEILTPLHDPEIDAEFSADSLIVNGVALGSASGDLSFADSSIRVQKFKFNKGLSSFSAEGGLTIKIGRLAQSGELLADETEANLNLSWQNIRLQDYAPLLGLKKRIRGITSGMIRTGGTAGHPQVDQQMRLMAFEYDRFRLDSLNMYSQYNDGYFLLDSLSGILNNTSFDLRGWLRYPLNLAHIDTAFMSRPFQLALRSKDDEISFISELDEQIERISGDYEMEFIFGGTLLAPSLKSGFVRMEDGEVLLSRIRDPLRHVQVDAEIKNSVFTLNRFSGRSLQEKDFWEKGWAMLKSLVPGLGKNRREGQLVVSGTADVKEVLRPRLDMKIRMNELYVDYFIENAAVVLSTENLSVKGQDTLFVEGGLFIPKGTYELDLSKMKKNIYLSGTSISQTPPFLAVNLDVEIPGNFVITSSPLDLANNFKIVILGNLHVIMEPPSDTPQIAGHIETVSGKYGSWNQNFEVQSGSIDFKNPKEINPDINITAVKMIGPRLFEVVVSGNLEDLDQEIRITENGQEVNMSYLDKITMLTVGADMQQISSQADSTFRSVGEDVATNSVLTAVERGAEKYVGLDKVEIRSNETLLDLERMKLNNGLKEASISFGKYLTSDLYVEYRTRFGGQFPAPRLSWQAGNRIGLQYRISRFWSVDSYYEKTTLGNNKVQLGIKWELTF